MLSHQEAAVSTGVNWRRLAPVAVIYFIVSNVLSFIRQFIVVLSVLAWSASSFDYQQSFWFIPVMVAIFLATIVSGVVSYWFYQYRIRNEHIEIRSGLFRRRNINLPFWRIQNVKIEQPFYYRLTHYTVVVLDTAGSSGEEAKIVAVERDYAQQLRQAVLISGRQHQAGTTEDKAPETVDTATSSLADDEKVINRRSLSDLIIHGLTNNRVWILLGALTPFYDEISGFVYDFVDDLGLSMDALFADQQVLWWQVGLYVISTMLLILSVMAMVSVAGSVITYYNYTLTRTSDRYIRRSGLFSLQEVSMRESRIQMISVRQDWLDYLLKRANFFFEQNKTGDKQEQELHATHKMLVPSVTLAEAQALATDAMPDNKVYQTGYSRISTRFISRWILTLALPACALVSAMGYAREGWHIFLVTIPAFMLACAGIYLRWRRWGFACDDTYCYIRKGMAGIDRYSFALFKVQQVALTQSVLMQRRGLANVHFILASGSITIPYIPYAVATELADKALWHAESGRRSWM